MAFRFRYFEIEDDQSSMRVGTDAMLLGAWARPPCQGVILDIGTGCGVMALMLAQKTGARIDAIDLDLRSYHQAQQNFAASIWKSRVKAVHGDVRQFAAVNRDSYNYIISNPPFFENSLKSGNTEKDQARHDVTLRYNELFEACRLMLTSDGALSNIIPAAMETSFSREGHKHGFHLIRQTDILSRKELPRRRVLQEWALAPSSGLSHTSLTILDNKGKYSGEYLELTREYHHF